VSKDKDSNMNRLITIRQTDKTKKITSKKEETMECEVEILHEGLFEGTILSISSSGRYEIMLTKHIEVK
jgi:hypothetical protein